VKYWLGIVSLAHVRKGVDGAFAQVCHGKKDALEQMTTGDFLIYYSPRVSMDSKERCECFTAIGRVANGVPYQVEVFPEFRPWRVDMEYLCSRDVPIQPWIGKLDFTQKKHWGMQLRKGLVRLSECDFERLFAAMTQ
jgi:hypothetical protein